MYGNWTENVVLLLWFFCILQRKTKYLKEEISNISWNFLNLNLFNLTKNPNLIREHLYVKGTKT